MKQQYNNNMHKILFNINKINNEEKKNQCTFNYKLNNKGNLVKRKICRYPKSQLNNKICNNNDLPEAID
jgi:hypothetical protein